MMFKIPKEVKTKFLYKIKCIKKVFIALNKKMRRSRKPTTTIDDFFLDSQIKTLLTNEKNFKPNLINRETGETALTIVTRDQDSNKMKLLLQHNADPNFYNAQGDTPLIIAARSDNEQAVKLLLKYGANVD